MSNSLVLSLNASNINNVIASKQVKLNDELLKEYARYLQLSDNTKATYLYNIKAFMIWLSENDRQVDYDSLIDYRLHLISKNKASSINCAIASLKSLFRFLEKKGITNYAKDLVKVKTGNNFKKDSLTLDQVSRLYASLKSDTEEQARTNAIVKLLIGCGLRSIEVVNANVGSIRTLGNIKVIDVQGKGFNDAKDNTSDSITLQPIVINAIQDYLKFRPDAKDNEPLFTSLSNRNNRERLTTRTIRNIVKGVFKQNGLISERLTTHSTRHTAITLALISGASIQETQQLARHKNINTTMIYAHNLNKLVNNAESKIDEMITSYMKGGNNEQDNL